jgi:PAS domain-containing protein
MIQHSSADLPIEPPGGLDERFCEVVDAAPVMIWVSGKDKGCVWFNRPWLAFTGRSMAQEAGSGWADGVHRDDFERCLQIRCPPSASGSRVLLTPPLSHCRVTLGWLSIRPIAHGGAP